jgi:hypothetical protein
MGEPTTEAYSSATSKAPLDPEEPTVVHREAHNEPSKWKVSKTGDGDAAMALFTNPDEIHEPIDPADEKKLIRKIDFMILPYLAVCYAFFYIDKVWGIYFLVFWGYMSLTIELDDAELRCYIQHQRGFEPTWDAI